MDINAALEYIHSLRWMSKKLGLTKTNELLDMFDHPEKKLRFVHVGGTNGKGSTSAMIAEILRESGLKVGLYTSPYIMRFNERIMISDENANDVLYGFSEITDEELAALTCEVKEKIDLMQEPPSEFEAITVIGFLYFLRKKCDIVVLEVGMGGEFDATNVIPAPLVTVMVNIGLDHMQYLGNTVTEIAKTKSGIIKKGSSVVFYGDNDEALSVIKARCEETGCKLTVPDFCRIENIHTGFDGQIFSYGKYKRVELSALGLYQQRNACVVLHAVEALKDRGLRITDKNIYDGLKCTKWLARLEVLRMNPMVIVDGSHNPQGMRATVDAIKTVINEMDFKGRIICVFGVMADKEHATMIEMLKEIASEIIAVRPEYFRAMEAEDLYNEASLLCKNSKTKVYKSGTVSEGVQLGLSHTNKDDILLCLGSLYMSGEVRNCFIGH